MTREEKPQRNGSPPRRRPPPPPVEPEPEPPPARLEDQKTQVRTAPTRPAPYDGRMQVNKPTLVGDDPLPPEESTNASLTRRARMVRLAQYGIVLVPLAVAAWAVLSTPRPRAPQAASEEPGTVGSLAVTLEPADAQLLLDGALVKDSSDGQWSAQKLSAGSEHVLTARRDGFAEQSASPLSIYPLRT